METTLPKRFELAAGDGHTIKGYQWGHWEKDEDPPTYVQILHGMSEHALRYQPLAEFLVEQGMLVIAHDHRGHGISAEASDLGHVDENGWVAMVEDARAVQQLAHEQSGGGRQVLLGHSMGSFMAQAYTAKYGNEVSVLLLSGSSYFGPNTYRSASWIAQLESWRKGRKQPSELLQWMFFGTFNRAFRPNQTDFDWLSRDAVEVRKYLQDPRCGFACTTGFWSEFLKGMVELSQHKTFESWPDDLPILIFGGALDPLGGRDGMHRLEQQLHSAAMNDVECLIYDGARHEILNETHRKDVYRHLTDWLIEHLPKWAERKPLAAR